MISRHCDRACAARAVAAFMTSITILTLGAVPSAAQTPTATTGVVSGVVTDASGGVLPGVTVELTDLSTNTSHETVTSESGHYAFSNLLPGRYGVKATLEGFQQAVLPELRVEVNKAHNVDLKLGVGNVTESVNVIGGAAVVLQHNDSSVINTMSSDTVAKLPNLTRSIESIQFNQPLAVPYVGGADSNRTRAGSVAGARTDQNTYTLDGADVSDNIVGDGFLEALPSAVVPLPAESVEEFSAATTNANATFGRASGAQFVVVTKRGTNRFRGSTYMYRQDDAWNANSWDRSRLGLGKTPLKDTRAGFSLGGPIRSNRTFFFTNYEGRRFPRAAEVARIVPTASLRAGLLRFADANGAVQTFDLRALDPRSIGLNPVVSAVWSLLPDGNDTSRGDGLNTVGYTGSADTSFNQDTAVVRLDHNFSTNWRVDTNYRYASLREAGAAQADIGGLLPGHTKGTPVALEDLPREPRLFGFGVTGQVSPHFLNETRFSYIRGALAFTRVDPFPQVSGTNVALDVGIVDEPINVGISQARSQIANQRAYQMINNSTWQRDKHTLGFGGTWRREYFSFFRTDQLAGSLTTPVALVNQGTNITIPASFRPATCGAAQTTNCVLSADASRFTQLYASALGIVDNVSVLAMRDKSLNPLPLGTPQNLDTTTDAFEMYMNDSWRPSPSLTLNLGASYQVRLAPKERDDRYAFLIDAATNEVINSQLYLDRARAAATAGQPYNPTLAFQPVTNVGRTKYYDTDWSNIGPRLAATWNPPFVDGWIGRLFRQDHSVLRGGYGLVFDRTNSVEHIFALGMGYGTNLSVLAPRCNVNGTAAAGCNPASTDPSAAYRVGIDGPVPVPSHPAVSAPIVPTGLTVAQFADPNIKAGRTHSLNFSYQRELPAHLLLETGWVLRLGRNLPEAYVLSSVPYFFKDPTSGQTLAQAFDAVAQQLRSGAAAGAVSPQSWFENQVAPGQTLALASTQSTSFIDGNLSGLWLQINQRRIALGQQPLSNQQIQSLWARGDGGRSSYQAFYTSVRRRMAKGLTFSGSYTLSKSRDQAGVRQNATGSPSSAYDLDLDWGPSDTDRRHVLNLTGVYDLPFGQDSGGLSRLTGGWYVAGIFAATSGVPLSVCQRAAVYGGGLSFTNCVGAVATQDVTTGVFRGVSGSSGIGTTGNPATGGSGINMFQDPAAAYNSFRRVLISQDATSSRGALYGLPRWSLDLSIGKRTRLTHSVNAIFTAEASNILNKLQYANGSLNLTSPTNFGVITSQAGTPRMIQLGFRVEF
jgi:hypothetical protein